MSGHSHGCGGCCHGEEHQNQDIGARYSLYKYIDTCNLQCLNEVKTDSGKTVFRPYEDRLDPEKFVESDCDEELLFNIPFTGHIKLTGIIVSSDDDEHHPLNISLFKNRPYMTFDDTGAEPEQSIELAKDPEAHVEYPVKPAKFNSMHHLSIHVKSNHGGAASTMVRYIGLRGDFSEAPRREVLLTNYEIRANPADHKADLMDPNSHMIS